MTTISPLLQNKLNNSNKTQNPNNRHEKIYEDLQKRAHEAKPNEAKAQMVKEGILGNPITATKDVIKDGANFFNTVKTGKIGDNNLGRINDLGLKAGALLIATYLAAHSRTKTESIMRFIGGGTFLAAMSLWPKLFINLPARLVHGFRIDEKYISAQGDKKDFFLDNQFLVWDAYPEDKLRKNAKNAGIDYDSKNGKEKIQRKMQKTALQNRTLWMATAGFATPLLTSMVGNFVEPIVKKAVVNNGYKNVQNNISEGIPEHIKNIDVKTPDSKELENLFSQYKGKALDDNFFKSLADTLVPEHFLGKFKDVDDTKVFRGYKPYKLAETLKDIRNSGEFSTFNEENLRQALSEATSTAITQTDEHTRLGSFASALDNTELGEEFVAKEAKKLTKEEINTIIQRLNGDYSYKNVATVLEQGELNIAPSSVKQVLAKATTDDTKFFELMRRYYEGPLAQIQARARGYIDMINPVIGSKAESVYTDQFMQTTGNVLKELGFDHKQLLALRGANSEEVTKILSETIINKAGHLNDQKYGEFLASLLPKKEVEGLTQMVEDFADGKNIRSIVDGLELSGLDADKLKALNKAVLGAQEKHNGLLEIIQQFIKVKQIDLEAIKSKALICANFERRLLNGDLKDVLSPEQIQIARKMLYDGSISTSKNINYVSNKRVNDEIVNLVFDKTKFAQEKQFMPKIDSIVDNLQRIFVDPKNTQKLKLSPVSDYMACGSWGNLIKKCATSLGNNKSWMKIFAPMTLALIAVTLLVQPLFGNIKKEFPEEKNGGAK